MSLIFILILFILIGAGLVIIKTRNENMLKYQRQQQYVIQTESYDRTRPAKPSTDSVSNAVAADGGSNTDVKPNKTILDSMLDSSIDLAKNPVFWGAVGTQVALQYILKLAFNKVAKETIKRFFNKILQKLAISVSKILQKIALKLGPEMLAKLGIKSGIKFVQAAAIKVAAKAGAKVVESGTVAASTGPAAPFVMIGLLLFDVLALTLDLTDALVPGGTVGYAKMGTKEEYNKMKDEVNKLFREIVKEQGTDLPIISGPTGKLTSEQFSEKINTELGLIMDPNNEPLDPLVQPMLAALAADIANGVITEEEVNDENVMKKYYDLLNMDLLTEKALGNICFKEGGKTVKDGAGNDSCSYASKEACDNSYKWPLTEDGDTYSEWDPEKSACVVATSSMRSLCEANGIPYNNETKTCDITREYCLTKGADWEWNPNINDNDCRINKGQEFAEFILGTTITRGIKQIFDPEQYQKCKEGEGDTGYLCNGTKCPPGHQYDAGLCYPECKAGFRGVGPLCWPDCPAGFPDHGAGCSKPESYGNGIGRIPDVSCPASHPNKQGIGMASWCDNGPRADFWNLTITDSTKTCNQDEFEYGGFCYPKCKAGFHNVGGNVCSPDCPEGTTDIGASCVKNTYGRGVGTPGTYTYAKQRLVPYSTKNN